MNYYRYALCVFLLISYAYNDLAVVAQSSSTEASTSGGLNTATTNSTTTNSTTTATTPSPTTTFCPSGQKQGLASDGNVNCLSPHSCNSGYTCLYSTTGNNYFCCSDTEVVPNATPSTTFTNCPNSYVEQPGVNSCLAPVVCARGYTCTYAPTVQNYLCCNHNAQITGTGGGTTGHCPTGQTQATSPTDCLSPRQCGTGYNCVYSQSAQNYICCSGSSVGGGTNRCTNGGVEASSPTDCLSPRTCGNGYGCVYSTLAQNYICCSSASG